VHGGKVRRSLLSPGVVVDRGATLDECILMDGVRVGRGARVNRCIVDKGVVIPPGLSLDAQTADPSFCGISPGGVAVVPKRAIL
jgi:glucose-1-phosphate adenylyltransferase